MFPQHHLPPALLIALLAAGCSCPNLPLDPLPSGGDSNDPHLDDSQPETNPWESDDPPDDTERPDEPTEGSNQLMNGGFEQGEGSYSGVGYGWDTADGGSHGEDWLDYHTPYAGTAAQCVTGSWSAAAIQQVSRAGTVTPGKTYRVRAMVRSQNASSGHGWYLLGLRWYQGDTAVGEVQMSQPDAVIYDWTRIVIDAEAPAGADRAAAYLAAYTDGTACYDDVVLTELTP